MQIFTSSQLWTSTLAEQELDDEYKIARSHLREAFVTLRQRAKTLADEIPQDLREYTVHDISHIDALWEMADVIIGDKYKLTPTEAFILGGSFLLHDLGMCLAAYPSGMEELKRDIQWHDVIVSVLIHAFGEDFAEDLVQNPPADILEDAKSQVLRLRHARKAQELALISWQDRKTDTQYFLIDHADLRTNYGQLIGKIAYSHWWPVSRLQIEFQQVIGAPMFCPREWTVDPLKLACLLRSADVIHLDERRAPGFLRSLRKLNAQSRQHGVFQLSFTHISLLTEVLTVIHFAVIFHNTVHLFELSNEPSKNTITV